MTDPPSFLSKCANLKKGLIVAFWIILVIEFVLGTFLIESFIVLGLPTSIQAQSAISILNDLVTVDGVIIGFFATFVAVFQNPFISPGAHSDMSSRPESKADSELESKNKPNSGGESLVDTTSRVLFPLFDLAIMLYLVAAIILCLNSLGKVGNPTVDRTMLAVPLSASFTGIFLFLTRIFMGIILSLRIRALK